MPSHPQRHTILSGLLALALLIGTALTAGPAQAASGVGPFYPEPAWDRKIAPINRFLILTNWASQAVLDKETGLVWERSPVIAPDTWSVARFACTGRPTGNRKGWRLPSVHELASLVDPSVTPPGPTLPPGHPFTNVQSDNYWSATTDAGNLANAWGVSFVNGGVDVGAKNLSLQVWCVRGGMNADLY